MAIKYYFFAGQRVAMKVGSTVTYLHGDHLGSTALATTSGGAWQSQEKYFAYGKDRDTANNVPTDHRFTGQKSDGSGLMYYQSRYYDPQTGLFVSPDTIVPDAGNVLAYNRSMYVLGRVMNANDPSGHEPINASNYPCSYTACVYDAMSGEWISIPNWTPALHAKYYGQTTADDNPVIITTWGVQAGFDVNAAWFGGIGGSGEFTYLFNWYSGDVMLSGTTGGAGYAGTPDLSVQLHGGGMIATNSSDVESLLGYSEYTTANSELDAGIETGASVTWSRAIQNDRSGDSFWPGEDYIDPEFGTTVDSLALNATLGVDAIPNSVDYGVSHGYSTTKRAFSFNLYSPFRALWE